ncbi:hypothetical protein [Roseovarius sp. D22-M7]|uniref:hypothetical protein n=1 Tax=Roseovarius sp. D22-M7 TaxID=3127116 RepID=UPI00301058AE
MTKPFFWQPVSVLLNKGMRQFDRLFRKGSERDSGGFLGPHHNFMFPSQGRAIAGGDEGWHVGRVAQRLAGAPWIFVP